MPPRASACSDRGSRRPVLGALPEDTNGVAVAQAAAQGDRAVEALLTLIDKRLTEPDIVKAVTRAADDVTQN